MRIDCLMWLKAVCQQGRNYLSIKLKEKPQLGNWLVGCIYIRYNMFHNICIYALVNGGCTTDPIHVYISSIYCKKVQIVERLCNDTIFIFDSIFFPLSYFILIIQMIIECADWQNCCKLLNEETVSLFVRLQVKLLLNTH